MERVIPGPTREMLTIGQVAEFVGVPENTFLEWIDEEKIPLPMVYNARVKLFPWRVAVAIRELIAVGYFPLADRKPDAPTRGKS